MIIDDIIKLKEKHGLIEEDATYAKQQDWYKYAWLHDLVFTEYEDGVLKGFVEYVYLTELPKNMEELQSLVKPFIKSKIVFIGNCIAESTHILWKLKRRVFGKNPMMEYICWHRKRNNIIKVFARRKKERIYEGKAGIPIMA